MFVEPKVYFVGYTEIDSEGMGEYLADSGNNDFIKSIAAAEGEGVSSGEILCSFYAKLCYASLTIGYNVNITRVRDIPDNIVAAFKQGHGSVFEHASMNFVARNVSRVLTHELVRHRVGTAFSQTSGRYVRANQLDFVTDPILHETGVLTMEEQAEELLRLEERMVKVSGRISALNADFATKKKLTSAARRWMPNGQANEIGFTLNIRSLRHIVMARTSRHAEREIRAVFAQVYLLCKSRFPLVFCDAKEAVVDGILEITGMRMQPYES